MQVGKQATLNDLKQIGAEFAAFKSEFHVVQEMARNGSVGTVIDGNSSGELGRGARSFGIDSFYTEIDGAGFIHVKTTLRPDTHNEMFHITLNGYVLGQSEIINNVFAGYCYHGGGNVVTFTSEVGAQLPDSLPGIYVSSDGFLTFRIQMTSLYGTTMVVDSMRVGNGRLFTGADIQIIQSELEAI